MKLILTLIILMAVPSLAMAETIEVGQENKLFIIKNYLSEGSKDEPKITIHIGDTVRFVNDDDFFHNVFSLSDAKLFDLGSFPKDEYRDVEFDQAGTIEVECAIHPNMKMIIEVESE